MITKNQNQKGFTLIELLIYISIVSVATVVFTAFTVDSVISMTRVLAVKEVNQNARLVLSQISQTVKTAQSISAVTIDQLDLIDKDGNTVYFYLNNIENTVHYHNGTTDVPMSNNAVKVTKLEFEQISNNVIRISLALSQINIDARVAGQRQLELFSVVTVRSPLY